MKVKMAHGVSIIGLDGATLRLVEPWVAEGRLPGFGRLLKEGTSGELQSTILPLSPQAWASFATGTNPGKHGIFEFVRHKPFSYELDFLNGGSIKAETLWRRLSGAGKRVCLVNVPMTYPPEDVNGILIAGFDSPGPGSGFCRPPELLAELRARFGPYRLKQPPYGATPHSYLTEISEQLEFNMAVADYLKAKEDWDLFCLVFDATDLVQHFYWHYMDGQPFGLEASEDAALRWAIRDIYERLDVYLGHFADQLSPEETLIVMSDHGSGPCEKVFFLDRWLEKMGYLTYRPCPLGKRLAKACHVALQSRLPERLKGLVATHMPGIRRKLRSYFSFSNVVWERTRVFSLGVDSTNIFINLKGKFPSGVVEPADYEPLRAELIERLGQIRNPQSGEPAVEAVYRREDLYWGPMVEAAPDLLVLWKGCRYTTRKAYGREEGELFHSSLEVSEVSDYSQLQKSGTHTLDGLLIARGEAIRRGATIQGARIIDLAPTVLHLLGEMIPQEMDGLVLEEAFEPAFLAARPVRRTQEAGTLRPQAGYRVAESEEVRRRLKGLGYID